MKPPDDQPLSLRSDYDPPIFQGHIHRGTGAARHRLALVYDQWLGTCVECDDKAVLIYGIADPIRGTLETVVDCMNCAFVSSDLHDHATGRRIASMESTPPPPQESNDEY